ncbi:hypothetical protein ACFWIF_04320 [Corynebacterium bovis]|uniref:hypothetical protein n=1 Tax=Corynebacterium bovis TaxID=36808 RepID=UPI0036718DE4
MTLTVNATVERDGHWWVICVPEYDILGQAAHISEVEAVAREITALWLDIDESDITVSVTPIIPDSVKNQLACADEHSKKSKEIASQATHLRRAAVQSLLDTGMTRTDAAFLLGISRQRVAQIVRDPAARRSA